MPYLEQKLPFTGKPALFNTEYLTLKTHAHAVVELFWVTKLVKNLSTTGDLLNISIELLEETDQVDDRRCIQHLQKVLARTAYIGSAFFVILVNHGDWYVSYKAEPWLNHRVPLVPIGAKPAVFHRRGPPLMVLCRLLAIKSLHL